MENKFIPLSVPNFKGNELKYVSNAVETEWVSTNGAYVTQFENRIAAYVKSEGAVSCQSGTAGLHIAMLVSGITREDLVIVPTLTFIAAVNPVKYVGAEPIFMDCDDSLCIDPIKLEEFCETECDFIDEKLLHKKSRKPIKALVIVHVFGNMADMESLMKIASKYHLIVIEDATEALGTYYQNGIYTGKFAGTIGDIGVYSFNGNKIITTGGGGILVSKHKEYLVHAKYLTTQAKNDDLYYVHDEIGYNYRMTNLQAALGVAQLEQLEDFIQIKYRNYEKYRELLEEIEELRLLPFKENVRSNYWFYGINCQKLSVNREQVIDYFLSHQIQVRPIWKLIHKQLPYQKNITYKIERAQYYWENVVNIPCSTNLTFEDIKQVVASLKILVDYKY